MRRTSYQFLALPCLTLVFLLSAGCGFQLQGSADLSEELQQIAITGVGDGTNLHRTLYRSLQSNGVTIDPGSDTVLAVLKNTSNQKAVTYTGSGQSSQYDVTNQLTFQLQNAKGTRLLGPYNLQARRTYQVDQNNTTASIAERELLGRELETELTNQVLRRLQAITSSEFQLAHQQALEQEQDKAEKKKRKIISITQ